MTGIEKWPAVVTEGREPSPRVQGVQSHPATPAAVSTRTGTGPRLGAGLRGVASPYHWPQASALVALLTAGDRGSEPGCQGLPDPPALPATSLTQEPSLAPQGPRVTPSGCAPTWRRGLGGSRVCLQHAEAPASRGDHPQARRCAEQRDPRGRGHRGHHTCHRDTWDRWGSGAQQGMWQRAQEEVRAARKGATPQALGTWARPPGRHHTAVLAHSWQELAGGEKPPPTARLVRTRHAAP